MIIVRETVGPFKKCGFFSCPAEKGTYSMRLKGFSVQTDLYHLKGLGNTVVISSGVMMNFPLLRNWEIVLFITLNTVTALSYSIGVAVAFVLVLTAVSVGSNAVSLWKIEHESK